MKNKILTFLILSLIIWVFGCGVQQSPKEDKDFIPEKISVEIPAVLKDEANSDAQKVKKPIARKIRVDPEEDLFSTSYEEVKNYVYLLDYNIKEIKLNNFFGNQISTEIQNFCEATPLNSICSIPANTFSLPINEDLIAQYEIFFPKDFSINEEIVGKSIPFDLIEFIKHDENSTYQYELYMNLTQIHNNLYVKDYIFDADYKSVIQNVKWAEDNNTVLNSITTAYENNEVEKYPWTIHYTNDPNIEEQMHLHSTDLVSSPNPSLMTNFDLTRKNDSNETAIFKLNQIEETFSWGERYLTTFSSYTELTKENGFETSSRTEFSEYGDNKERREEIFDNNGTLLASTYCNSYAEECNVYDSSTWFIDTDDESIFDPLKDVGFEELKITGDNLKSGEYFLLPPTFDLNNLTAKRVHKENIGTFIVFKEIKQGVLYDKTYLDSLDKLIVVYALYNDDLEVPLSEKGTEVFEVLSEGALPTLNI